MAAAATTERQKIQKRRDDKRKKLQDQKAEWYRRNAAVINSGRKKKIRDYSQTGTAIWKRIKREKEEEERRRQAEYQRTWRAKKKNKATNIEFAKFPNRMNKARALKKMKDSLPKTPTKRAATIAAYLTNSDSPVAQSLKKKVNSVRADENNHVLYEALMSDIKENLKSKKKRRSNEARNEMTSIATTLSGEAVNKSRCKIKLAKKLGLPARTIAKGYKIRTQILHTDDSCFKYTTRKIRKDALSEHLKRKIYDFWCAPDNSHPSGNKNDIKRVRIGAKTYTSHTVQVLRKTQTEIYTDFKQNNPTVKISQRSFERCKPFFVRQATAKDRVTCCCRYHIEMKSVFRKCMDFRKKHCDKSEVHVYDSIYDMCAITLCDPVEENHFKHICLDRKCVKCGVTDDLFTPLELSTDDSAPTVKWECFEYQNIQMKGTTTRKLLLVKRETKPGELFRYLAKLLKTFPGHNFRSKWQNSQFSKIVENLPQNHCVTVHDYSENYQCSDKIEIQSSYFQKTEVSVHVTLLYRHAIKNVDGIQSTIENPEIILEHFYVISADEKHDQYFTHKVQEEVATYLKSIDYKVDVMHEFCDGCAVQYKSRNCYGDVAFSVASFKYKTLIRNFYETSHAKGPQDAAGGLIKRQADLAVLRGSVMIQNARDLFEFAQTNLTETKSEKCQRRIFRYCESVDRSTLRPYKPIPGIRSTHQVIAHANTKKAKIETRSLSCYECTSCIMGKVCGCKNAHITGRTTFLLPVADGTSNDDAAPCVEEPSMMELIHEGIIFAALCEDEDYDYYLVRADTSPFELKATTTDEWGATWPFGTSVIKGHYYIKSESNPLVNTLQLKNSAIIPVSSVLYIIESSRKKNKVFNLNENDHQSILKILEERDVTM